MNSRESLIIFSEADGVGWETAMYGSRALRLAGSTHLFPEGIRSSGVFVLRARQDQDVNDTATLRVCLVFFFSQLHVHTHKTHRTLFMSSSQLRVCAVCCRNTLMPTRLCVCAIVGRFSARCANFSLNRSSFERGLACQN